LGPAAGEITLLKGVIASHLQLVFWPTEAMIVFFSFRTLASGAAVAFARQHKKLVRRGDQLGWVGGFTMGVCSWGVNFIV